MASNRSDRFEIECGRLQTSFEIFPDEKVKSYNILNIVGHGQCEVFLTTWGLRIAFPHVDRNFSIPRLCIAECEKIGYQTVAGWYGIKITLSSGIDLELEFVRSNSPSHHDRKDFFNLLKEVVKAKTPSNTLIKYDTSDSWANDILSCRTSDLELSNNTNICSTYPVKFIKPKGMSLDEIKSASGYRSRNRFPFLTYIYPNGAGLSRCSQPKVGFIGKHSKLDIEFVQKLAGDHGIQVIDCRPKYTASANRFKGGGFEDPDDYGKNEIIFLGIPNIHKVRAAYLTRNFTNWSPFILKILAGGFKIAELLHSGTFVMVHCTDGWDRTSQVCALAQVLLDVKFRTIDGFKELIEKDWLALGHQFGLRNAHHPLTKPDDASPIFAQFLDCVFQIYKQFPTEFEFNEKYLDFILFQSYAQDFGDFNLSNDRDRSSASRKPSIWPLITPNNPNFNPALRGKFTNLSFNHDQTMELIPISVSQEDYQKFPELFDPPLFGAFSPNRIQFQTEPEPQNQPEPTQTPIQIPPDETKAEKPKKKKHSSQKKSEKKRKHSNKKKSNFQDEEKSAENPEKIVQKSDEKKGEKPEEKVQKKGEKPEEIVQNKEEKSEEKVQNKEEKSEEVIQKKEEKTEEMVQKKEEKPEEIIQNKEEKPEEIVQKKEEKTDEMVQNKEEKPEEMVQNKEEKPGEKKEEETEKNEVIEKEANLVVPNRNIEKSPESSMQTTESDSDSYSDSEKNRKKEPKKALQNKSESTDYSNSNNKSRSSSSSYSDDTDSK